MQRLLRLPKSQIGLTLFAIFISAFLYKPSILLVKALFLAVGFTLFFDFLFLKIRGVKGVVPISGLVSGLIIGLLNAPQLPWYEFAFVAGLAMASKHFLSLGKKHIFNPAAFGLFFGSLLFAHDVSWWGVSWQQFRIQNLAAIFFFLLLLTPGYISVYKMRRYKIIFTFLITYFFLSFVLNQSIQLLDPTVLFFSLVMLPEPMTTPQRKIPQILFGIFIAAFSLFNAFSDPLITALLVGNLAFFKWRY